MICPLSKFLFAAADCGVLSLESPEKVLSLRARVGGRHGVSIPSWLSRESVAEIGTKNPDIESPLESGVPASQLLADDSRAVGKYPVSRMPLSRHSVRLATSAFSQSSCHGALIQQQKQVHSNSYQNILNIKAQSSTQQRKRDN